MLSKLILEKYTINSSPEKKKLRKSVSGNIPKTTNFKPLNAAVLKDPNTKIGKSISAYQKVSTTFTE